jgi:hypothetical protein
MSGEYADPAPLRREAVVGLVVSVLVGVAGLFALPAIQALTGLPFFTVFWAIVALEFLCAVGAGISVMNLHED